MCGNQDCRFYWDRTGASGEAEARWQRRMAWRNLGQQAVATKMKSRPFVPRSDSLKCGYVRTMASLGEPWMPMPNGESEAGHPDAEEPEEAGSSWRLNTAHGYGASSASSGGPPEAAGVAGPREGVDPFADPIVHDRAHAHHLPNHGYRNTGPLYPNQQGKGKKKGGWGNGGKPKRTGHWEYQGQDKGEVWVGRNKGTKREQWGT